MPEIYSYGHRNPQGLFAAPSGDVWLTEHGPQGGDELNFLKQGVNYGYPIVTYGVEYGTHSWPFDPVPGSHEGYTQPYYSWVPSIAVSQLAVINDSPMFKLWRGDLMVSSLKDRSLYRMRVREQRVVMVERIPIGERIRDILQKPSGEILLWTDSGSFMIIRPSGDRITGAAVFDRCVGCHASQDGRTHGFGPDLYGVVGREVASAEDFHYSPALKAFGGTWSRERLDDFLAHPQATVPGSAMQFSGIPEPSIRTNLIDYLASKPRRTPGQTVVPD